MIFAEFVDWFRSEKAILDSMPEMASVHSWRCFTDDALAQLSELLDNDFYVVTEADSLTADLGEWIEKKGLASPPADR